MTIRSFHAVVFGLLAFHSHSTADWPQFRGPSGQGLVSGTAVPENWGSDTDVLWKADIPGRGWSSPIIYRDQVFLTTAVDDRQQGTLSLRALCLDGATGRVIWNREVFGLEATSAAPHHAKNSDASPTPIIADDRLYVHFGHLGTAALDLKGKILWKTTELRYPPVHGNGGSPIVAGKALIFSCDGRDEGVVVALDRTNGQLLWRTPRTVASDRRFSFSTPLAVTVDGQVQIVSPGSNMVAAYEPETGKELWKVCYDGYSVIPRPVTGNGLVYVCTGYNTPMLLAIRLDGRGDVTESHIAWKASRAVPHTPSLLLEGDNLFMVSDRGIASCLDSRTGAQRWQERLGGNYSASPLLAGGRIYLLSEEGTCNIVEARATYRLVRRVALRERILASPAVAANRLYLRTEAHLFCFEEKESR